MRKSFEVADRNWTDIGSDVNWVDYGGTWARKMSDTEYLVLQFENCEDWGDGATGYHVSLSQVDLDSPQLESAMKSCDCPADGLDTFGDPIAPENYRLCKVSSCVLYGAKAPLFQESGRNVRKLVAAAKREARTLMTDREAMSDRLDQPVNAIMTSARNYRDGKIWSSG